MATPPPVHSSSVIIGPPDELTKLVWYQFLEKRSVGRGIGVGLLAVSATSFSLLFRPWTWFSSRANTVKSSQIPAVYKVLPVVIGIASLVAGLRLRTKKYFKDPEAMREYVQLYHNECFAEAFKQLGGWDDLSRVATKTMMQAKVERELMGFVPGVEKREMKFDDVWQLYTEVSGHPRLLMELIQREVIDIVELRRMAVRDLEYSLDSKRKSSQTAPSSSCEVLLLPTPVRPSLSSPLASSHSHHHSSVPSSSSFSPEIKDTDGILATFSAHELHNSSNHFKRWPTLATTTLSQPKKRTLLYRMRQYSAFLIAFVGVPSSLITAALDADSELEAMAFEEAIHDGICDLSFGSSSILPPSIIRSKCTQFLSLPSTKFDEFVELNGRLLLEEKVIDASLLAPLFLRDCLHRLSCVDLLDEWYEWPLKGWGKELGLDDKQVRLLSSLSSQLSSARLHFSSEIDGFRETQRRDLKKAKKRMAQEIEKIASSDSPSHKDDPSSSKTESSSSKRQKKTSAASKASTTSTPSTSNPSSSSSSSSATHPSVERLNAELDLEEMRIQETYDHSALNAKRRLEESERLINESWKSIL